VDAERAIVIHFPFVALEPLVWMLRILFMIRHLCKISDLPEKNLLARGSRMRWRNRAVLRPEREEAID
jgi:hypothetical protein